MRIAERAEEPTKRESRGDRILRAEQLLLRFRGEANEIHSAVANLVLKRRVMKCHFPLDLLEILEPAGLLSNRG